jgi:hypothetical protein
MVTNIQPTPTVSDSNLERGSEKGRPAKASPAKVAPEAPPAPAAAPRGDLRLVIDRDQSGLLFVYKLIDPDTGNVVIEIPRHELRKLGEAPDYRAGSVISAEV